MPEAGFGSGLWNDVRAVRFGPRHELLAPIRADGSAGIVVGADALAAHDRPAEAAGTEEPEPHHGFRRLVDRWHRP